nr:unnamed protein product [Digitaria exilis]
MIGVVRAVTDGAMIPALVGVHALVPESASMSSLERMELVPVAVEGTRNVINAAADEGARRVVFTSSYGAVHMDPNRSPDAMLDESCWSDYDFCKNTDNLYCCAKMMAEITATEQAALRGLQLAVVVPCMTMGPMLQQELNFSSNHVARYLMGTKKSYPNAVAAYVDVRDVARAHVLSYERPGAHGRYLCIGTVLHRAQLIAMLRELFPQYPVTAKCEDDGKPMAKPYRFSSQRLKDLGLEFTPLKKSLYEAVVCMQQKGHLPVIQQQQCAVQTSNSKNAHLLGLEGARERLTLRRADVLDYESLLDAFRGCHGVFHVASPVSNDPELVPVAVEGTRNVINAAADEGVRRVVFTSSYGAVHMDPNRSPDAVLDETCWSDYDFCQHTDNMYCCAKMMAEITATAEAARRGLHLAVVVPCVTTGPMLQQTLNFSSNHIARYLMGTKNTYPNAVAAYVDVRDVARAHVLAYERPGAHGRYLCIGAVLHRAQLVAMLRDLFPEYPVTAKCEEDGKPMAKPYRFSNQRVRDDLGLEFTPLKKSLYEAVVCMQQKGHLPVIKQHQRSYL